MGHAWSFEGQTIIAIKGSAENVIEHCVLQPQDKKALLKEIDKLALQGLRVLAAAYKIVDQTPRTLTNLKDLQFVSLMGFHDPPKPEAKQAVLACYKAGIAVRMITGDHPQTALHIAEAVGIKHGNRVVNGFELEALSDQDLAKRIKDVYVFSRVIPEQKLRIVRALQASGEIVAMIGDGVNDAPSLKESDVGIAMGRQGTNVAREAADIILTDDKLVTIVNAIHDGRRIYDNIQKAVSYIFGIHIYIILTALIIPLLGLPSLLLPIHIILLELIIDPTCSLVFEGMPAEPDIMQRKPRDPAQPLISNTRFMRIILKSLSVFVLTAATYIISLKLGMTEEAARTLGFSVILWSNLFQVLSQVSRNKITLFALDFFKNKTFLGVYAAIFVLIISLIYLPGLNRLFGFASVPILLFALTILIGYMPTLGSDLYKKLPVRGVGR
ncbi:MAG: cation-translocating P-type ATPase [Patescibacteria group bacterium]|jgi:Ca2+-transporting ATPase